MGKVAEHLDLSTCATPPGETCLYPLASTDNNHKHHHLLSTVFAKGWACTISFQRHWEVGPLEGETGEVGSSA